MGVVVREDQADCLRKEIGESSEESKEDLQGVESQAVSVIYFCVTNNRKT
jgi:hypothetical protein